MGPGPDFSFAVDRIVRRAVRVFRYPNERPARHARRAYRFAGTYTITIRARQGAAHRPARARQDSEPVGEVELARLAFADSLPQHRGKHG